MPATREIWGADARLPRIETGQNLGVAAGSPWNRAHTRVGCFALGVLAKNAFTALYGREPELEIEVSRAA